MSDDSKLICVGTIAGAFGVRGEVRIKSYCAQPEAIAAYAPLVTADGRSFTLRLTGSVPQGLSARLSGVDTRDAAEALKGCDLFAPRDRMPRPDDDEFYHADLIGLEAVDPGGVVLGRVAAVLNHGASDLLEISGPDLKSALLVPFTRACVPTVDVTAGRLIVDLPEES